MFIILAYDVRVSRINKVRKVVKQYLSPVQKSVFEGFLSEGKLKKLKDELLACVDTDEDSIRIYTFPGFQGASVLEVGKTSGQDRNIL